MLPNTNAPALVAVKCWPILPVPNVNALISVMLTSLEPEFVNETAPVKLFAWVKVIAFAPAAKLEIPGITNAPVCVIAPFEINVKLFPIVDAANIVARLLVKVIAFAPLLDKVIAPVKLFDAPLVVKSIVAAPAVKLDVPVIAKVLP